MYNIDITYEYQPSRRVLHHLLKDNCKFSYIIFNSVSIYFDINKCKLVKSIINSLGSIYVSLDSLFNSYINMIDLLDLTLFAIFSLI